MALEVKPPADNPIPPHVSPDGQDLTLPPGSALDREATRRTRRSFIGLGLAGLGGVLGWRYLLNRPDAEGTPLPFRRVLDANGRLSAAYFRETRLAPEFAKSQGVAQVRTNGTAGLQSAIDLGAWRLRVQPYGGGPAQEFTLADIKALPRIEMTTQLKCIEGWSIVVNWAGTRFADFLAKYPLASRSGQPIRDIANPPADLAPYVSLVTPDEKYYVGLDMHSAIHPQTLLCYEINGQPLSIAHGAPLRLVTPLKYGIKHLKRIGTIAFADVRPADYWAELGYDWDAGH
ncbi:molybdopterin-dependent oxidoreductase [Hymenobacter sp. H14-R3]|uniref:molybdopterin-dependent oxidoreductase n=1 Tax=Hymenobacter sp. H14-R3 TaxID=3046308 RepID=UPI0024BA8EDE|nr:molybdopterin-dependent oxidoreductase [Hymenobacter sp. H14-R3]MDJ0364187.1 molybdopterin-dependent oxidoreductase [Hymenobacter sp. H14-R3]